MLIVLTKKVIGFTKMLIVHKKNLIVLKKKAIGFAKNHSPKVLFTPKSALFPIQSTKNQALHKKNKPVFTLPTPPQTKIYNLNSNNLTIEQFNNATMQQCNNSTIQQFNNLAI